MKKKKLLISILLIFTCALLNGSGLSTSEPKLKLLEGSAVSEYTDSEVIEMSLGDDLIKYRVPKDWVTVQNDEALTVDAGRGHGYFLNALKSRKSSEYMAIFYFSNEQYLAYDSDANEKNGVERAIICNICPGESKNLGKWSVGHYTFPPYSTQAFGKTFDYYVANYETHRAEFVFTPAKKGMCVILYLYNEDYSSAKDIKYIMKSLEIAK